MITYGHGHMSSDNTLPSYFQSPWAMVIDKGSGTVPADRFIKLDLEIDVDQIEISLDDYPTRDFYQYDYYQPYNYKSNPNKFLYEGVVSCFYRPLIVVDFSSRFQYK